MAKKKPKAPKEPKAKDPITGSPISGTWHTVGSSFTADEGGPWDIDGTFLILSVTKGSTPYNTYYSFVQDKSDPIIDTWIITGYTDSNKNGIFGDSSPHVIGDGNLKVVDRTLAPAIAEIPPSEAMLSGTFESSGNTINYYVGGKLVAEATYLKSPWTTLSY